MVKVAILLLAASTGAMIGVGVSLLCQSCKKDEYFTSEDVKTSKYIEELISEINGLSKLVNVADVDLREHIRREEERSIQVNNRLDVLKFQYDSLDQQENFRNDMVLDKLDCVSKIIVKANKLDIDKQNKIIHGIYDELEDLSLELGEDKSAICRKINELKPHMKKKRKRR